jgi:predicted Zn-dependent peptidase
MRAPKLTQENLSNQIDVVKEEIRLNVLNRPYGGFPWILLPPVLYSTYPNAHNGYGDFVDLEQASLDDCAAFFDTYYAPANAVLTVAGDFTPDRARELIQEHFGDVPARPAPPRRSFSEPRPTRELRGEHTDPHAPLPALAVGYRMPDPVNELDGYLANLVLAGILSDGDGSRLQQRLVHREPLVTDISAGAGLFGPFEARDPDTFSITAIHPPDVAPERVLTSLDEELDKLAATPADAQELAKVTARWSASLHSEHDKLVSRTLALGSFELLYSDAALVYQLADRMAAITTEDVAKAANALRPDSRAVLVVHPEQGGK